MLPEQDDDLYAITTHVNGTTGSGEALDAPRHDPEAFVLDLSAEHPFFEAEGQVSMRVGRRVVTFQLCTVPYDTLQRAVLLVEPRLPKVVNKVTRQLDKDVEHPLYQEWDQLYPYLKILLGLRQIVLRNARGEIVWQSTGHADDDPVTFGMVRTGDPDSRAVWGAKLRSGVQALKDMKITAGHVLALSTAIDELSKVEEADATEALLGE